MRTLVFTLICLSLAACAGRIPGPEAPRLLANLEATHRVDDAAGAHGSAVVIDARRGMLLTSSHVVSGGGGTYLIRISVDGRPAIAYPVRVVARDEELDLAVIRVGRRFSHEVAIGSDDDVHMLDEIYNLGFPHDLGEVGSRGHIKAVRYRHARLKLKDVLLADFQGAPGTSGSGVYLARDGRLIGLMCAVAHIGPTDHRMIVVRILVAPGQIRAFLDRAGVRYRHAGD